MKHRELRTCKSRSEKREVRSQKNRLAFLFFFVSLCLCASEAFPQSHELTEVEGLQGENLVLKLDSIDKQMQLLQEQYRRLAEQQASLVRQLQEREQEILKARGLKPGESAVNWQTKRIEKTPKSEPRPSGVQPAGSGDPPPGEMK